MHRFSSQFLDNQPDNYCTGIFQLVAHSYTFDGNFSLLAVVGVAKTDRPDHIQVYMIGQSLTFELPLTKLLRDLQRYHFR